MFTKGSQNCDDWTKRREKGEERDVPKRSRKERKPFASGTIILCFLFNGIEANNSSRWQNSFECPSNVSHCFFFNRIVSASTLSFPSRGERSKNDSPSSSVKSSRCF